MASFAVRESRAEFLGVKVTILQYVRLEKSCETFVFSEGHTTYRNPIRNHHYECFPFLVRYAGPTVNVNLNSRWVLLHLDEPLLHFHFLLFRLVLQQRRVSMRYTD